MTRQLKVSVVPGARLNRVQQLGEDHYKIHLMTLPEKGLANQQVLKMLASALSVSRSQLTIKRGVRNRDKIIAIEDPS